MNEDQFFQRLAEQTGLSETGADRAPSPLKARVYSALVATMASDGPLRSLPETSATGRPLCVFEQLLCVIPVDRVTSMNPCRVCHARVLAEHLESPPIYWPHCPYVAFKKD
ncbi:MAG TPA: hypothetical protein VKE51_00900 [Vicinamibacterales bacterium]|nr:hypothetical protein [Vicinamibacterales bacterium]